MAKGARFSRGSSGSPKHTEVKGAMGYDAGNVGPSGPRVGPGVEGKKVRPEYGSDPGRGSGSQGGKMRRYSEE